MNNKTVFISYRHDDIGEFFSHKLKETLTNKGYDVFLDEESMSSGPWKRQIYKNVIKRSHFLLLITPGALDDCNKDDDWVRREYLLARKHRRNIVPVFLEPTDIEQLRPSTDLSIRSVFDFEGATVCNDTTFDEGVTKLIHERIDPSMAPVEVASFAASFRPEIDPIKKYAEEALFGRDTEENRLDDAWNLAVYDEPLRPRILTFVAPGGAGKTSLVAKWVVGMTSNDWSKRYAVFAWSFYNSETGGVAVASSDPFFSKAFAYFGDTTTANGTESPQEKGKRLAHLIGDQCALLILDGVELLQAAPTLHEASYLTDDALATLLTDLAVNNKGLCVVTTRYSIKNLPCHQQNNTVKEVNLDPLTPSAGEELLKSLKVTGEQNAFDKLVEDLQGHALTLKLLGTYLRYAHAGDIRRRDQVKLEEANKDFEGGHAFHVIEAYVRWLGKGDEISRKALSMLRLLGLFDRPASADCLDALLSYPIVGLTDALFGSTEEQRNQIYTLLENTKLLTASRSRAYKLIALDAHPLVREYFATQLRNHNQDAWRTAHRKLFEHLCETPNMQKNSSKSKEDLQPLYQAVVHGCLARMYSEAFKVFLDKIHQGPKCYSIKKLGAVELDLKAILCFFEQPWTRISIDPPNNTDPGWLFNEAASRLYALGRLDDAYSPMQEGLKARKSNSRQKAESGGCLSELKLTMGEINEAIKFAEQSVKDSDQSGDTSLQRAMLGVHAYALYQSGDTDKAKKKFTLAEKIQVKEQGESVFCFQHCELLLAPLERAAWQIMCGISLTSGNSVLPPKLLRPASQSLKQWNNWKNPLVGNSPDILSDALDHLRLGRTALYEAIIKNSSLDPCREGINLAVEGLRRAGRCDYLPGSLLTRAWIRSLEGKFTGPDSAQTDLEEAREIAERGPMPLFHADIYLYRARLFGGARAKAKNVEYPWVSPQGGLNGAHYDLKEARRLIDEHGYGRREAEHEDAQALIK